jgi:hypothetical protein
LRVRLAKLETDNAALSVREERFAAQVVASAARERALRDRLANWSKAEANGDELATCGSCGDFRAVAHDDETGGSICQRCESDRLRDRLAKLEAALAFGLTQLETANELLFQEGARDEEDGVGEMRAWIHAIRAGLLKDKGGA